MSIEPKVTSDGGVTANGAVTDNGEPLHVKIVNQTLKSRRFVLYQENASEENAAANDLVYAWDSRLLEAEGGFARLELPLDFQAAGLSGEPLNYSSTAPRPTVYGECWAIEQEDPAAPLRLTSCENPPVDPESVVIFNQVGFAYRIGALLKLDRPLFGTRLGVGEPGSFIVSSSFWVGLADVERGKIIAPLPLYACEVTYQVPNGVTLFIVTALEDPNTGAITFDVVRDTTPLLGIDAPHPSRSARKENGDVQ